MIYFKRKAGSPILVSSTGIELPDIVIVPKQISVIITKKSFELHWSFYYNANSYLMGKQSIIDDLVRITDFGFYFTEDTSPNFQEALDQCDWTDGGDFSQAGGQIVLNFFGNMSDPTTEDPEDKISDNWDGMIYNP